MKYSKIALSVLAAKECGIIKTNAQFWGKYSDREKFDNEIANDSRIINISERLANEFDLMNVDDGIICAYDEEFPIINRKVKNNGDKPFLMFYRGDISLISDLNRNVAVIGLIDPDEEIAKREKEIISRLVKNDLIIVSGLAVGCDSIAHKICIENKGRTVAILPSQLGKIYPAENRELAEEIVKTGGLLISEYYKDASSKYEAINRFIERDRLQAMFSKGIILIASYRKDEGDSGSRHAMEAAKKYEIERYAMYNGKMDDNNKKFGLNKDLINTNSDENVKVLLPSSIEALNSINNVYLSQKLSNSISKQLKLL